MEYLIGNKETFLTFLNKITKEDKIAILSHDDLDGIASCIFLEKILVTALRRLPLLKVQVVSQWDVICLFGISINPSLL